MVLIFEWEGDDDDLGIVDFVGYVFECKIFGKDNFVNVGCVIWFVFWDFFEFDLMLNIYVVFVVDIGVDIIGIFVENRDKSLFLVVWVGNFSII